MIVEDISLIQRAIDFAKLHHSGQTRKYSGKPYVVHPFRVYRHLLKYGVKDEDVLIASILHDILEDTPVSYKTIKEEFGKKVADIVDLVTNKGDKASHIKLLMRKAPKEAVLIKVFDRIDNLNDGGSDRFFSTYKETTDIIRDGLIERGFLKLYRYFNRFYQKVYGSG